MVVKCILIFTMIVWKFIRREACRTVPLFRTEIHLQFHQREETQFWQIYLIGWDIWNVKVVDSEKSLEAMNFKSTMMKVKSRLLDQIGTSLQL